jgi:hypothetical protein
MTSHSTTPCLPQSEIETAEHLFDNWFDPIEAVLRDRAREFLQAMFEAELAEALARSRYARRAKPSPSVLATTATTLRNERTQAWAQYCPSPVADNRHGILPNSQIGGSPNTSTPLCAGTPIC